MATQRLEKSLAKGYQNVDRTADPKTFVKLMDDIRRLNDARAGKERSLKLLALRKGNRALDAGCGPGDDARALAKLVGPHGRVVGIDTSETMIDEARKRSENEGLPVEFLVADARKTDFPDDSFDGARTERMLVHMTEPDDAVAELVRVTRPGGRVVATEPDMETWIVHHPDHALTRRIMNFVTDDFANGWAGRQLHGLFTGAGLTDVIVLADNILMTDPAVGKVVMNLDNHVERCREAGVITKEEADGWLAGYEDTANTSRFLGCVTMFTAMGRKP